MDPRLPFTLLLVRRDMRISCLDWVEEPELFYIEPTKADKKCIFYRKLPNTRPASFPDCGLRVYEEVS